MEIGSFIEMDLRNTGEYYDANEIARLNCARAGIYHALRILSCSTVYIPHYQCDTVRNFLLKKGISINYYFISSDFEPLLDAQEDSTAILIVNYFGIFGSEKIKDIARRYKNVIIDNSQAFFSEPIKDCMNIYSPRKFFGVPDGCYIIGKNVSKYIHEYEQDTSSDTSNFLLKRIEKGCSAVYSERMENEKRIEFADVLRMSKLTIAILRNVPYAEIMAKRQTNFKLACSLYENMNLINPCKHIEDDSVPMVYPLVLQDKALVRRLVDKKIYTGRWWQYVLDEVPEECFERFLSTYMVPLPIDQRYETEEIEFCYQTIIDVYKKDGKLL